MAKFQQNRFTREVVATVLFLTRGLTNLGIKFFLFCLKTSEMRNGVLF